MSHQSQIPAVVLDYCQKRNISTDGPVLIGQFFNDFGWHYHPLKKLVSRSELLRLRRDEGASKVRIGVDGHSIDFSIKELVAK